LNFSAIFSRRTLLVVVLVVAVIVIVAAFANWPSILTQINPKEKIDLVSVTCPQTAYRSQNLPISINIMNTGNVRKDVLVEVLSPNIDRLTNKTSLSTGATTNLVINLPVKSYGDQSFKVKVYWVGVGEYCKIEQASVDKSFTGLAADYEIIPINSIASLAQHFDWSINLKNTGNTPAEKIVVKIIDEGQLIISTPDTQIIKNLGVGQTQQVSFGFSVPHDAKEGKSSIMIDLTTSYPSCNEAYSQTFGITLQKSQAQVDLENATSMIYWIIPLVAAIMILLGLASRKNKKSYSC